MNTAQRQILKAAADLVESGWCQGEFEREINGITHRCAARAVSDASIDFNMLDWLAASRAVNDKAKSFGFPGTEHWNDNPNVTKDHVVSVLRSLASEGE